MLKFLLGVLVGVLLVFVGAIFIFAVALHFREQTPPVASNSVLVLRLEGDIPEKPPLELPLLQSGRSTVTVADIWSSLRRAGTDSRIKAVVLAPSGLSAGWAKLQELRMDLEQFRKSGKPVYAYLRNPGTREYYVALAADRIYLGPTDPLMFKGLRAEIMYFKNTLDKLGVSVEVEHAGKYKDYGDMFTRADMSPETREVLDGVVSNVYDDIVSRTADARHKTPEEVRALIDRGPFTSTQAAAVGLVDALRFEDQMFGELKDRLKSGELSRISLEDYVKASAGSSRGTRVALVVGEGDIVRGDPDDGSGDASGITSYGFNKLLRQVAGDDSIKGVVVRIDSPGGEVMASDEIWRQMNLLSAKKPTVISMSDLAASGGYYMAMTGDPIVAYPLTETGSIGVVFGKPNLRGLYNKLGVTKDSVQRGTHAGIDSDYTSLTPEEQKLLRDGIDESYHDFVSKVAKARRTSFDKIEPFAQGRVWMGNQAQAHGLVDRLGGLDTAIEVLKTRMKLPATEQVRIVTYPPRRSLLDFLFKSSSPEDMLTAKLGQVFGRVPFQAWMHGGFLRIAPQHIEIR